MHRSSRTLFSRMKSQRYHSLLAEGTGPDENETKEIRNHIQPFGRVLIRSPVPQMGELWWSFLGMRIACPPRLLASFNAALNLLNFHLNQHSLRNRCHFDFLLVIVGSGSLHEARYPLHLTSWRSTSGGGS